MRRSPELHFVLDRSEEYADRIERLLKEAKNASAKETRDE
jgi:ribosome-binding factor A